MELKNILAATDFSASADTAVQRAGLLARQHGAALHLMHVVPSVSWQMFGRMLVEHPLVTEKHLHDAARDRLQQAAQSCRQQFEVPVTAIVEIGRPHECLAAYANKLEAGLAVFGPHDESLARDLFVGSTARKLLHKSRHPTLIARGTPDTPYRRVLVAIDFSEASRLALEAARRVAPDAAIHVMHVVEVLFEGKMRYAGVEQNVIDQYRDAAATESGHRMHDFLADAKVGNHVETILKPGNPARALLDEAQALQADLIVMGKRGRSELDQIFLGSVTENILHDVDRDLLLITD